MSLALGAAGLAASLSGGLTGCAQSKPKLGGAADVRVRPPLRVALMQTSLARTLQGDLTNFARTARTLHQARAIGYASTLWTEQARELRLLRTLSQAAKDEGVTPLLLQVDDEGLLGDADRAARTRAVVAHHKWADAAKALSCEALVVRPGAIGQLTSQADQLSDGLASLSNYTAQLGLRLLVRNGGVSGALSTNPVWLTGVLRRFDSSAVAGLADFEALAEGARERDSRADEAMRVQMPFSAAIATQGVTSSALPELPTRASASPASMLRASLEDAIAGRGESRYAPFRGYVLIDAQEPSASAEDRTITATRELIEAIVKRYRDGLIS